MNAIEKLSGKLEKLNKMLQKIVKSERKKAVEAEKEFRK